MSEPAKALMVVRLRTHRPDGTTVGERERTCHLVPYTDSDAIPRSLMAYCGLEIAPGSAELLDGPFGMPCELCLARSPIPAFTLLRQFGSQIGGRNGEL